jgi:hypothetical protein
VHHNEIRWRMSALGQKQTIGACPVNVGGHRRRTGLGSAKTGVQFSKTALTEDIALAVIQARRVLGRMTRLGRVLIMK